MILTQIEEVTSELGEPDCKLIEPFVVQTSDQKNHTSRGSDDLVSLAIKCDESEHFYAKF